jgi:release factor glutamine methyltransferase
MPTVLEVLQKAEAYLAKAGIETPKIDAGWMLAETLGCKRIELFLEWGRPLDEPVLATMRDWLKRRAGGEPLQYIFGYSDFHHIRLNLRPGVLIPRPETELLVDKVLQRLEGREAPRIVDLGTGSGAIALALAAARPDAKVLAVERSPEALDQARENAVSLGLKDRVAFRSGSWLEGLDLEADCIVSNPPYLTEAEWASARPEVREHEPKEALVAADKGLADLKVIMESAIPRLAPGGLLALETGIAQRDALVEFASSVGYAEGSMEKDDSGRDRYFFARKVGAC